MRISFFTTTVKGGRTIKRVSRREAVARVLAGGAGVALMGLCRRVGAFTAKRTSVADFGAVGDGKTLNTERIQSAINQLASKGGGTLAVPKGVFLSGAIFLKPGVNLHLDEGAVLKGSTDRKDYPKMRTRIEGHFEEWLPALVNADKADHLRIGGSGTLVQNEKLKVVDVQNLRIEKVNVNGKPFSLKPAD